MSQNRVVQSNHRHVEAVQTISTTRLVKNGLRGCEPLPVTDLPNGGIAVAWIPAKRALKALRSGKSGLNLVVLPDGSMSMTVMGIEVVKEN